MNKARGPIQAIQFACAISLALLGCMQVEAQPVSRLLLVQPPATTPSKQLNESLTFAAPKPPAGIGAPTRRSNAGSRGCPTSSDKKKPLTALVPVYETPNQRLVWGVTTAEQPTFWVYLPYRFAPEHSVEFVLKDDQENYVYKTKFPGQGTPPGIVNLRLPSSVSLEANKDYSWHFLTYCDSQTPSSYVNGLIRRVERPSLESQLKLAKSQERTTLYATNGIWHDALTNLAELRRNNPENKNLKNDWARLLQSIGLEQLASETFVQCCSPEN